MPRNHKNLKAFQLSHDLAIEIYAVTKTFPRQEVFGLTNQLRRSATSVPSNIVEGCARRTLKDYLHFLYIASGSLAEAGYFIELSHELGYLRREVFERLNERHNHCARTLQALISSLEKKDC
jgi:four helix bundle protein